MKTKIALFSAAALLTTGIGMHLSGHCPFGHHEKAGIAHVSVKKDAKTGLMASR